MRLRVSVVLAIALSTTASAKEVFLSIAGSVGTFRTDTHIFNPSATKDIVVHATFLRAGGDASHPNNTNAESTPPLWYLCSRASSVPERWLPPAAAPPPHS